MAQVHRFRDSVAIHAGEGATRYMTPLEARSMARALIKAARSCEREAFVDSAGNTAALVTHADSLGFAPRRDGDGRLAGWRGRMVNPRSWAGEDRR